MLQSKNQGIGTAGNKAERHQALPDHRARAEKQYLLLSQRYESRPLRKREAGNKIKSKTARNRRILFPHVCRAGAYDLWKEQRTLEECRLDIAEVRISSDTGKAASAPGCCLRFLRRQSIWMVRQRVPDKKCLWVFYQI